MKNHYKIMFLFVLLAGTGINYSLAQCIAPGSIVNFAMPTDLPPGVTARAVLTNLSGTILVTSVSDGFKAPVLNGGYRVYVIICADMPRLILGSNIMFLDIDCSASDQPAISFCVSGGCADSGSQISFLNTGNNTAENFVTVYAITDEAGAIKSTHTSSPVTMPETNGNFNLYAINYDLNNGRTAPDIALGRLISDVQGTCSAISEPLSVCVSLSVLPVTLASFSAVREGNTTRLDWTTTEESNADRFYIQRSDNAIDWTIIGDKSAAGNTRALTRYHFNDASPEHGTNYYRLKMADLDGTFAFSKMESVRFDLPNLSEAIYPNPASDILYLKNTRFETVKKVTLMNAAGLTVLNTGAISAKGIDVKSVTPGLYTIRINHSDHTIETHKVMIAH